MAAAAAAIPVLIYILLNTAVWDRGFFFAGPGVEQPGTMSRTPSPEASRAGSATSGSSICRAFPR